MFSYYIIQAAEVLKAEKKYQTMSMKSLRNLDFGRTFSRRAISALNVVMRWLDGMVG